jgi:hypothetical protein
MRIVLDVSLSERLPERVEEAAYYVVCEALTNVIKYGTGGSGVDSGVGTSWVAPQSCRCCYHAAGMVWYTL